MTMTERLLSRLKCLVIAATLACSAAHAGSLLNIFTYQGHMQDGGVPASGSYDFRFDLFDDATIGTILSSVTMTLAVVDGTFTAEIPYSDPDIFVGDQLYLEIRIGPEGQGASTVLSPRQPITATPLAISALIADEALVADEAIVARTDAVNSASVVDGTIVAADIDETSVQRRISATCPAGQAIRQIGADGSVVCEIDDDTVPTYQPGTGLTLSGNTFSITPGGVSSAEIGADAVTQAAIALGAVGSNEIADGSVSAVDVNSGEVQRRVTTSCVAGSVISEINADGTATCESTGIEQQPFSGSAILSDEQQRRLNSWVGNVAQTWVRCYQLTAHTQTSGAFHSQCNNRGPSVSVLEMPDGRIFGGYTENSWSSLSGYRGYDKAFLFVLSPGTERFPLGIHYQASVYDHVSYGPTFGNGHDLHVNATMSLQYCNFPYAYSCDGASFSPSNTCAQRLCGTDAGSGGGPHTIAELEVWVRED